MDSKKTLLRFSVFLALVSFTAATVSEDGSLTLAADRTRRPDPLNRFDTYTGGWNLTNRHYWASVGFTGVALFAVGALWFIFYGFMLLIALCCCCCRKEKVYKDQRSSCGPGLIILILLALAALAGSFMLYFGEEDLNKDILDTLDFVVGKADYTEENLRNVTGYLIQAKSVTILKTGLPVKDIKEIDSITGTLSSVANTLQSTAHTTADQIKNALQSSRHALIILAAVTLLLPLLGVGFLLVRLKPLVYFLALAAWFLVALTFILCGVYVLFYNTVSDTCVAMDQWVNHPTAKTALDRILPCVDPATAQQSLNVSKVIVSDAVFLVNQFIDTVANTKRTVANTNIIGFYNHTGPKVPKLCDPNNVTFCSTSDLSLSVAPEAWKKYVCNVTVSGNCNTTGRLTPDIYQEMAGAVNVSYGLDHYVPFFVDLGDCKYVRDAFSTITRDYCSGLRKELRWIFIGLAIVSAADLFSAILWVI